MQLTIYNVEGRKIYNTAWADPSSVEETIDLSNFPSGIYFLQFEFKGVVAYKKVVKAKFLAQKFNLHCFNINSSN